MQATKTKNDSHWAQQFFACLDVSEIYSVISTINVLVTDNVGHFLFCVAWQKSSEGLILAKKAKSFTRLCEDTAKVEMRLNVFTALTNSFLRHYREDIRLYQQRFKPIVTCAHPHTKTTSKWNSSSLCSHGRNERGGRGGRVPPTFFVGGIAHPTLRKVTF